MEIGGGRVHTLTRLFAAGAGIVGGCRVVGVIE
jgi:hypothetical protein